MYAPLRLALASPTPRRGPVLDHHRLAGLPVDDPGYAIRSRLAFPAHDDPADGPGERYAYNVAGRASTPNRRRPRRDPWTRDGRRPLAAHPAGCGVAVVVPGPARAGTALGRNPVTVSRSPRRCAAPPSPRTPRRRSAGCSRTSPDVTLEAPTEEREEAIQSGGAHYAESLPVEYQPTPVPGAVPRGAGRRRRRGSRRPSASSPRWCSPSGGRRRSWSPWPAPAPRRRPDAPLGAVPARPRPAALRGLDRARPRHRRQRAALAGRPPRPGRRGVRRRLDRQGRHHPRTRRRARGVRTPAASPGFDPEMAVLADPGCCVRTYGTREDYLIPSACLNSTVSGLVSRTVLRADLVGPNDFHGAKFYRELAGADVSVDFLDTGRRPLRRGHGRSTRRPRSCCRPDRSPTWEGWAAVERISEEYGIHDVNLVKPGVGETTRVLLRRVPWKILARAGRGRRPGPRTAARRATRRTGRGGRRTARTPAWVDPPQVHARRDGCRRQGGDALMPVLVARATSTVRSSTRPRPSR